MLEKQCTLVCGLITFQPQIMLHIEYVSEKTLRARISETNGSSLTAPYVVIYAKNQQSILASV